MSTEYSKRQSLFSKEEHVWRVDEDSLAIKEPGSPETHLSWKDVAAVRLAYAPTRAKTWRYVFVLNFKSRKKVEIDNVHFSGFGSFEERSSTYVPFVRAALEKIRLHAPNAKAQMGAGTLSYALNLIFVSVTFLLLGTVLMVIPTPLDAMGFTSFIKLGIIIVLLPALYRWVTKARPRKMRLDEIPPDALPKIA